MERKRAFLVAVLATGAIFTTIATSVFIATKTAEHGTANQSQSESSPGEAKAVVKAYLRENCNDPDVLDFVRWWPIQVRHPDAAGACDLVHVKFRTKNAVGARVLVEALYWVRRGKVVRSETDPVAVRSYDPRDE